MSVNVAKQEMRRVLSTRDPEVVCISGRWGVGKTYAWREQLEEARKEHGIALKRYAYVSLFGVNSLDDLKFAIFANGNDVVSPQSTPSFDAILNNIGVRRERPTGFWWIARRGPAL
jgi:hypothetical protein